MFLNRKLVVTFAVVSLTLLAMASQARANSISLSSVDWTYQTLAKGSNWTACVTLKNGSPAGLGYTFSYSVYTQSGSLNSNGCFTVLQTSVGSNFSYGTSYGLTAGGSKATTFVVTTTATLGATIVSTNRVSPIAMALMFAGTGAVAIVIGLSVYAIRRRGKQTA